MDTDQQTMTEMDPENGVRESGASSYRVSKADVAAAPEEKGSADPGSGDRAEGNWCQVRGQARNSCDGGPRIAF